MTALAPRLRMFAGPNGSGKSTIKDVLPPEWLGVYINADELEKSIRADGYLNLADFQVSAEAQELQAFFTASTLLQKAGLLAQAQRLTLVDNQVQFGEVGVNSYFASVLADFVRQNYWRRRCRLLLKPSCHRQIRLIFCERPSRPATALTCILWPRKIPTLMLRVFSLV